MTKPLIVIVPGSKTKMSHIPLVSALFKRFYAHFGVKVEGDTWLEPLRINFAAIPADVMIFRWSGGISPFAIHRAAKELKRLLLQHKDREILLFTKSLGGVVAEKAIGDTELHVKRFIYIATPHFKFSKPLPHSIQVINVFSPADIYQKLANRLLYFGFGRTQIPNALNILLPNVRHSDFNHDEEVFYQGEKMRMFEFYRKLLL